ncbi:MAG: 30S ribosomal protein S9 [Promethearchaeota archaeon]
MRKTLILESGKRKTAIARARLIRPQKDDDSSPKPFRVRINKVPVQTLEPKLARMKILEALNLFVGEKLQNVKIDVTVRGGGVIAQCDAARIAITKCINALLKKKRATQRIRSYDKNLLSGDSRRKEPKKWGGRGARARFQKSYR